MNITRGVEDEGPGWIDPRVGVEVSPDSWTCVGFSSARASTARARNGIALRFGYLTTNLSLLLSLGRRALVQGRGGTVFLLKLVELRSAQRRVRGSVGDGGNVGYPNGGFETLRSRDARLNPGEHVGRDPVHEDALREARRERNHGDGQRSKEPLHLRALRGLHPFNGAQLHRGQESEGR